MCEKYYFGIYNSNKTLKIVVIPKSKWIKGKRTYCLKPAQEIKNIFDYYNYDEIIYDSDNYTMSKGEFINNTETRTKEEIIRVLHHSYLLTYNENLSNFLSIYVHCFIKELFHSHYKLTLYIDRMIDWNTRLKGEIENDYINNFLSSIGFINDNTDKSSPMGIYIMEVPVSDTSEKTINEIIDKIRKNGNIQSDPSFNNPTLIYHQRKNKSKGIYIDSQII